MDTKEKKAKTWMMVIETKSHRGLSCYRNVLFVTAANHHEAQAKARDWCSGEQIIFISILPFDPNQMGDAMIDCTEKNPLPEHPNIDSRWIAKYKSAETYFHKHKHLKVKAKEEFDGIKLGVWIHKRRNDYRNGFLTDEQIRLLEDIGMIWKLRSQPTKAEREAKKVEEAKKQTRKKQKQNKRQKIMSNLIGPSCNECKRGLFLPKTYLRGT